MTVDRPLVSAIMPAYNAGRFLRDALGSALGQDYTPFEVIVCNDGSTDDTGAILAGHPAVRVIMQENRGPAAARNAAIAASRGTFLAMFDADDTWPQDRVTKQVLHLLGHPEISCVLGRQEWIDPPPWLTRDAVYDELDGIPLASAMYRREILTRLPFDGSLEPSEDMDVLIRMREQGGRFTVLPDVLVYRRFHGGNLTAHMPEQAPILRSLRQKLLRQREGANPA